MPQEHFNNIFNFNIHLKTRRYVSINTLYKYIYLDRAPLFKDPMKWYHIGILFIQLTCSFCNFYFST